MAVFRCRGVIGQDGSSSWPTGLDLKLPRGHTPGLVHDIAFRELESRRETHPECEEHHPIDWGPDWIKRRKEENQLSACIPLSPSLGLPRGYQSPLQASVTPTFPTMMDSTSQAVSQNKPLPSPVGCFLSGIWSRMWKVKGSLALC